MKTHNKRGIAIREETKDSVCSFSMGSMFEISDNDLDWDSMLELSPSGVPSNIGLEDDQLSHGVPTNVGLEADQFLHGVPSNAGLETDQLFCGFSSGMHNIIKQLPASPVAPIATGNMAWVNNGQQQPEAAASPIARTKSEEDFLNQIFQDVPPDQQNPESAEARDTSDELRADQQNLESAEAMDTSDELRAKLDNELTAALAHFARPPSTQCEDVSQIANLQEHDAQFQGSSGGLLMPLSEDLLEAKIAKREANRLAAIRYRKRKAEAKKRLIIRVGQLEEKFQWVKSRYDTEQKEYDDIIAQNKELQSGIKILKLEVNMAENTVEEFRRSNSRLCLDESNASNRHMQYSAGRFPNGRDMYGWGHAYCHCWHCNHNHFM